MGPKKICIVGAGMSGLCACKHLLGHGLDPVVLEAQDEIGGVWRRTFSTTKLQTPSLAYQFSDFPWPQNIPEFASRDQVMDYFYNYAVKFDVLPRIRFGCKVSKISFLGSVNSSNSGIWGYNSGAFHPHDGDIWQVIVQEKKGQEITEKVLYFDFVVMCVGRFGDVPNLPAFNPPEDYKGKVMHSMEYSALGAEEAKELVSGKRVVVVGFQKSALDLAAEVADANEGVLGHPCTLVLRNPHWIMPHFHPCGINLMLLCGTRFWELANHKPNQGWPLDMLSILLFPWKWAVSKFVELYLKLNFPLSKYNIVPTHSFHEQLSSCRTSVLPNNFFEKIEHGQIRLKKSPHWKYSNKGILLDDGTEIEADVIMLCTGYNGESKMRSIFHEEFAQNLQDASGVVPLYRGIIHPRIPHMAFIGYQEDVSNVRASDMAARWVAYFLNGSFHLPNIAKMEKDVQCWIRYMKQSTPFYRRACVAAIRIWHTDQLCRDIGWNPYRKGSWLQELFSPYSNMDYQD